MSYKVFKVDDEAEEWLDDCVIALCKRTAENFNLTPGEALPLLMKVVNERENASS